MLILGENGAFIPQLSVGKKPLIWYNWKASSGANFSTGTISNSRSWTSMTYNGSHYIAIPSEGTKVAISANGVDNWQEYDLPSYSWKKIVSNGNNVVAIASDLYRKVAYSSDGGYHWSEVTLISGSEAITINDVVFGNGVFIAISSNKKAFVSSTGANWNSYDLPSDTFWFYIGYGNETFIVMGSSGNKTAYSTDNGETWQLGGNLPRSRNWISQIKYGNGTFIICTSHPVQYIERSTDNGLTWSEVTLPEKFGCDNLEFGNGYFMAVSNSNHALISTDGTSWSTANIGTTASWKALTYGNDQFVCAASGPSNKTFYGNITNGGECYTEESEPTTSSTVYSAPSTASALTITSVGTGTITLSDTNTYNYNPSGNIITH